MAQNLNAPMTIPGEEEWVEAPEGAPLPGGSDEKFIAKVNAGEGGALGDDKPTPPERTYADLSAVVLPVPVIHPTRGELRHAEVRELNGEDEEYLSQGRIRDEMVARLVERGTVSLEGHPVDLDLVKSMPLGNRDALMLAIRRATYGDTLDLDLTCKARDCGALNEISVDLVTEVEEITAEDTVEVPFRRGGSAKIRWPNGYDSDFVMRESEKNRNLTFAQVNTILLGRILIEVNGETATGERTAKALSMPARKDIVNYVDKNQPGPTLDNIEHTCVACGRKSSVVVDYDALFR